MTIDLSQAKPGDVFLTRNGKELEYIGFSNRKVFAPHVLMLSPGSYFSFFSKDGKEGAEGGPLDLIAKKPEVSA